MTPTHYPSRPNLDPPDGRADAPIPSQRSTASTNTSASAVQALGSEGPDAAYAHLEPVLVTFAATAPDDPHRAHLRQQLIAGYLPVAHHVARRYTGRGEPLEDLEQVGALGLLKAIDRFEPDLGHHFLSYAIPTITGEIRRHFRDRAWSIRVSRRLKDLRGPVTVAAAQLSARLGRAPRPSEIAAHLDIPAADVVDTLNAAQAYRPDSLDAPFREDPDAAGLTDTLGSTDPRFELFTTSHALAPHLAALPQRERSILIMRFYQDMTQTQIAEKIGVSQMHISRILSATLAKLRDAVDTDPTTTDSYPATGTAGHNAVGDD